MEESDPTRPMPPCRRCGAPLSPEQVNEAAGLARCDGCGVVTSLRAADPATPRRELTLPPGWRVEETPQRLCVSWPWYHWTNFILLPFVLLVDSLLVFLVPTALKTGDPFLMAFPQIFVAIGLAGTWYLMANFLDRTFVEAEAGRLRLWHAPLPWFGQHDLVARDVVQIFVRRVLLRSSKSASVSTSYELHALLGGNREIRLVKGFSEAADLLYLEHALERRLGIADHAVEGEVARPQRP